MPTGISQSVANPAAFTQRGTPSTAQRTQESSADTQNSQSVLAADRDQAVRAPDPNAGSQNVENNRIEEAPEPPGRSGSGEEVTQATQAPAAEQSSNSNLGGNVDITA